MIEIKAEKDCCGCSACEQTCPKGAIQLKPDKKGFLYPVVDRDRCVDCGLCDRVCPMQHVAEERKPSKVYAVKNKDLAVRLQSSSGGVFSILAEDTLKKGGVVYGAIFDSEWNVVHSRTDSLEKLPEMRGSKYVQSRMGDTFRSVKEDLRIGRKVLFSGTPCQVAGLRNFLRKDYANLLTVDFVCHGVPNPRIWQEYLKKETAVRRSLEKVPFCSSLNSMSSIEDIKFRDKRDGWKKYRFVLHLAKVSEGKKSSVLSFYHRKNTYMQLFLNDYILRPSCHNCPCRKGRSGASLTLGDFWDIERFYPEFFDDNGVSLCIMYNNSLPQYIADACDSIITSYKEACWGNPCILHSYPRGPETSYFYWLHDTLGLSLSQSLNICLALESCRVIVNKIYHFLKRAKKALIK